MEGDLLARDIPYRCITIVAHSHLGGSTFRGLKYAQVTQSEIEAVQATEHQYRD